MDGHQKEPMHMAPGKFIMGLAPSQPVQPETRTLHSRHKTHTSQNAPGQAMDSHQLRFSDPRTSSAEFPRGYGPPRMMGHHE